VDGCDYNIFRPSPSFIIIIFSSPSFHAIKEKKIVPKTNPNPQFSLSPMLIYF
jgi:hypothetical protein